MAGSKAEAEARLVGRRDEADDLAILAVWAKGSRGACIVLAISHRISDDEIRMHRRPLVACSSLPIHYFFLQP